MRACREQTILASVLTLFKRFFKACTLLTAIEFCEIPKRNHLSVGKIIGYKWPWISNIKSHAYACVLIITYGLREPPILLIILLFSDNKKHLVENTVPTMLLVQDTTITIHLYKMIKTLSRF